jgi:anti-anti-sigma factor
VRSSSEAEARPDKPGGRVGQGRGQGSTFGLRRAVGRDGVVRVVLRGELDYQAAVEHADALRAVIELRDRVVVDLAQLHFVDTSGLRFLIQLANGQDRPLRLENVRSAVARVIVLTGIGSMFDVDMVELP